jgi:hypothetical protein
VYFYKPFYIFLTKLLNVLEENAIKMGLQKIFLRLQVNPHIVARQRLGNQVTAAMTADAILEEMLDS